MTKIKLYRRRFIPDEILELKNDLILNIDIDNNIIITKWKAIRHRSDFSWGCSCYYLKDGFKISKFFDHQNNFLYWYCDIIDAVFNEKANSFTFNDLLVDVIVSEDGFVKVLDLDELADAFDDGVINKGTVKKALRQLDKLLTIIYSGNFYNLTKNIENLKLT